MGIVSWNTSGHLDACLSALPASLAGMHAEIVVVDNASDDDSVAIARAHPGVEVTVLDRNTGYAFGMNRALVGSTAPFLIALNPDTVPPAGALRSLVETLRSHPDAGVAAPRLQGADGGLQHSCYRFPSLRLAVLANLPGRWVPSSLARRWWLEGRSPHDASGPVDWAIGAVHCIRRAALEDDGPVYRERWFMYVEDLDLCWRLSRRGWRTVLDSTITVTHVGNVAGEQAWGKTRTGRWLRETYDWYALERGVGRARLYAAINLLGAAVRLGLGRVGRLASWELELARAVLPVSRRALRRPLGPLGGGTMEAAPGSPPTT